MESLKTLQNRGKRKWKSIMESKEVEVRETMTATNETTTTTTTKTATNEEDRTRKTNTVCKDGKRDNWYGGRDEGFEGQGGFGAERGSDVVERGGDGSSWGGAGSEWGGHRENREGSSSDFRGRGGRPRGRGGRPRGRGRGGGGRGNGGSGGGGSGGGGRESGEGRRGLGGVVARSGNYHDGSHSVIERRNYADQSPRNEFMTKRDDVENLHGDTRNESNLRCGNHSVTNPRGAYSRFVDADSSFAKPLSSPQSLQKTPGHHQPSGHSGSGPSPPPRSPRHAVYHESSSTNSIPPNPTDAASSIFTDQTRPTAYHSADPPISSINKRLLLMSTLMEDRRLENSRGARGRGGRWKGWTPSRNGSCDAGSNVIDRGVSTKAKAVKHSAGAPALEFRLVGGITNEKRSKMEPVRSPTNKKKRGSFRGDKGDNGGGRGGCQDAVGESKLRNCEPGKDAGPGSGSHLCPTSRPGQDSNPDSGSTNDINSLQAQKSKRNHREIRQVNYPYNRRRRKSSSKGDTTNDEPCSDNVNDEKKNHIRTDDGAAVARRKNTGSSQNIVEAFVLNKGGKLEVAQDKSEKNDQKYEKIDHKSDKNDKKSDGSEKTNHRSDQFNKHDKSEIVPETKSTPPNGRSRDISKERSKKFRKWRAGRRSKHGKPPWRIRGVAKNGNEEVEIDCHLRLAPLKTEEGEEGVMRRRRRSRSRRSRSKSRSENEAGKSDVEEMEEKRGIGGGGGGSGGGSSGRSSRGEITPNNSSNNSPMSPRSPARNESSLPNVSQDKIQHHQQQKPCLELPGFYFDEVKKRYFKILPKSFQAPAVVTQEVVQQIQAKKRDALKIVKKKQSQEQQPQRQQRLLQQTLLPLGIDDTASETSSINDTLCSVGLEQLTLANDSFNDFDAKTMGTESKPWRPFSSTFCASSTSTRGNIVSMLAGAQTGSLKSMRTTESRSMTTFVRSLMPWKRRKIFEKPRNTFEHLDGAMFVEKDVFDQSLLCMWNVKNTMCQRIQLLDLNLPDLDEFDASDSSTSITTDQEIAIPHSSPILQSLNKVTDLCWAPEQGLPGSDHWIIYTTTSLMCGSVPSFALLRNLDSPDDPEVGANYSLGSAKVTWSCTWNSWGQRFCIGCEKGAMMIDARSRRSWDINTGNQDVLCQTFGSSSSFSSDPNLLFSGLRNGTIAVHDLRTSGAQPKFKLARPHRHLADNDKKAGNIVTSLKFPSAVRVGDGSYIYSGTSSGEITLWDLRRRHPVQVFLPGSSSSSASSLHALSRNPIGVSDDSDFLYRASADLKVRFWSLDSVGTARKRPFAVLDPPKSLHVSGSPSTSPSTSSTAASLGSASSWAMSAANSAAAAADKDAIPRPIFSRRWKSPGQPSMPLFISLVKDEVVFYRGLW